MKSDTACDCGIQGNMKGNLSRQSRVKLHNAPQSRFLFCVLAVLCALILFFANGYVYSFFSGFAQIAASIGSGSVNPVIENLQISDDSLMWTTGSDMPNSGLLRINTSDTISFNVRNAGKSAIAFSLDIEFAWNDTELGEAGILFLYPDSFTDEQILFNLQNADYSGALMSVDLSDASIILTVAGHYALGMRKTLDVWQLSPLSAEPSDYPNQKSYAFKLFFYQNDAVNQNPVQYQNKEITVNIAVNADLIGRQTAWAVTEIKTLELSSRITTFFPIIEEITLPKVYFITQTDQINLAAYARASDVLDGDITSSITITSSPAFDFNKAGTYIITYNVQNSAGNYAAPLEIEIVVWDFIEITSGYYHTLALTSHGEIYAWGYNAYGQIGDGTNTDRPTPVRLNLSNIIDVAAGIGSSYALAADGTLYSWGRNENGRLGTGNTTGRNSPGLVKMPEGVTFTSINARFATAGGITPAGDVYTWGYGSYGAAGTGRGNDVLAPEKINLSNIAYIELGYYNGAAISRDGVLYTWGDNLYGQLGNGASMGVATTAPAVVPYFSIGEIKLKSVSVGYYHMTAVSENGALFTWGYGADGRLGNGSTTSRNTPQTINMSYPGNKALAGYYHTAVLCQNGTVYFFGQNAYGKHGSGNTTTHTTPYLLDGISGIIDISMGMDSSFVLVDGKLVYGMGYGGTGVLGTGNNNSQNTPTLWAFTPPSPR